MNNNIARLTREEASISHFFCEGVYAKKMRIPQGHWTPTHIHADDHVSALVKGKVKVEVEGKETIYEAPAFIFIGRGRRHRIESLEDSTWFCIHITDETDPNRVDSVLVNGG